MQQTEIYKLNLIETSDVFSPNPLNENMEKVEAAIAAETAALEQRIVTLEGRHAVGGTYTGNGKNLYDAQTIYLGFTPEVMLIKYPTGLHMFNRSTNQQTENAPYRIVEGGFEVRVVANQNFNQNGAKFMFFAIN